MDQNAFLNELYLFNEGTSSRAYRALGCHALPKEGAWRFAVWAPHAKSVSVSGSFNGWSTLSHPLSRVGSTGVWCGVFPEPKKGDLYKYAVTGQNGETVFKADPFAARSELRPGTASVVYEAPCYAFSDEKYMSVREERDVYSSPMSIYEVHLGSFEAGLNYRELADLLSEYVLEMGYTHIELMPLSEYPLDMSWGYQVTGYYAITSRYGTPEDFCYFVEKFHERGIGVILDWVPAHFPKDEHGLRRFDGAPLFEHADPRRSEQPDWGTLLFDYGKTEVVSFLVSNAVYLLREFHVDGLRVDAVSCMLYLDYGKKDGEWLKNRLGGRENLDAIEFLKTLSRTVKHECKGALLFAEESTAFPYVTKPADEGGLGFDFKWNMGWMNDTLSYMSMDPVYRKWHHDKLTFSMCYAFSEHFVLPLSHDEVVHGKRSLIGRMCGEYDEKFAQLRLLYAYQYAHPGKKLMFMGSEFAQFIEWDYRKSLDRFLLSYPRHGEMQRFVAALNGFYREHRELYECESGWDGFEWLSVDDAEHSVIAFLRKDKKGSGILCAFNFTPVLHEHYPVPFPDRAELTEMFSSDEARFGGRGEENKPVLSEKEPCCGRPYTAKIRLAPFGAVFFHVNWLPKEEEPEEREKPGASEKI